MGVADVASGADIVKGNAKVNAIFVAEVFNTKHGLDLSEIERAKKREAEEQARLEEIRLEQERLEAK